MSNTVIFTRRPLKKCRAIVQFGPPSAVSGMRGGEYFQVTVDPGMVSPGGDYIRFGQYPGDEILGWQRIECITVAEVLGESDAAPKLDLEGYTPGDTVEMAVIE